jgi:hypothetical protein
LVSSMRVTGVQTSALPIELFIDQEGDGASTFTQITAYSSFASQFTLTALNSNIGPAGKTYRVRI